MKRIKLIYILLLGFYVTSSAQVYDFQKFIEEVKKNNKDILIAQKEVLISQERERQATSNAYPQINAEAGYNRNLKDAFMYTDFGDLPAGLSFPNKFKINYKNEFSFQTVLSQQIFNYKVFKAIQAAKEYQKLTDYTYDATRQGVINGSKKAFYQALLLKEVLRVNKEAEKNARENYEDVKKKFEQGIVSEFDLLQAEVRWKNQIPVTTQAERNFNLAINNLKILAGIPSENEIEIKGDFETYPVKPSMIEFSEVLSKRPDFNALKWERNLRETNIDAEKAGHFPTLYGSFVYRYNSQSDEFKFQNENNYLIAGLTLKIPIFSGWNVSSRVQEAKIEVDKTELKINKAKDQIYTEIANIELKMDEALARINSAKKTLETAKKAFQIADISSKNGLATQLELKDARVAYDKAQLNFYSAVYDYLESYFDWQLAIGAL